MGISDEIARMEREIEDLRSEREKSETRMAEMHEQIAGLEDTVSKFTDTTPSGLPGDSDAERTIEAVRRYGLLVDSLEAYGFTPYEIEREFSDVVERLDKRLEDYDDARRAFEANTVSEADEGEFEKTIKDYFGEQTEHDVEGLVSVRDAALELLRDIDWNRSSPDPLGALREALRSHVGHDDIRAPLMFEVANG